LLKIPILSRTQEETGGKRSLADDEWIRQSGQLTSSHSNNDLESIAGRDGRKRMATPRDNRAIAFNGHALAKPPLASQELIDCTGGGFEIFPIQLDLHRA
jgi:hypothetical protein